MKKGKMRLWESPYTYVRTAVMRTLLIPKADYKKLMKMSLAEISNYLGETQYSKEMNELGVRYSGLELIEQALNKNFKHTIAKLKRISPDYFNDVIDAYLLKFDIDNIKVVLRAKAIDLPDEELKALLLPIGLLSEQDLDLMRKKENEEMFKSAKPPLNEFYLRYKELPSKQLVDVETALDHFYFRTLLDFAKNIPRQGKLFREFLVSIIQTTNLLTFFRLKKENFASDEIKKHIFFTLDRSDNVFMRSLLKAKTKEEIHRLIAKSPYPIKEIDESSLIPLEIALNQYLFRKTLLFQHQNPLSVNVILSYLFAKEIEIRNIKSIVKAKNFGMDMEKVEPLVIA
ncbi:hypothetical protein GOV09_03755 [Candidatus Woesearchaeota archaeon]|nr:hypothetical protein [Candidatus Woesearchaeota archaeon]